MRGSRRWHAVILVGAVLTAAVLLAPAGGSQASTSTNNNACFTAVSSTYADVPVTMSGTATPSSATLGVDTVTLSGTTAQATFSAALFLAGYRLQILQVGSNSVAADVTAGVIGTNTQEGSISETVSTTQTVVIVDPTPANRSSGDESAQPVSVTLNLGSSTWTPTGGNISFKQGEFSVTAKVGPINVVIGPCTPGTATGCDGAGANCTGKTDNPNPTPFAAVTVVTGPPPTTQAPTTTGGQATTTTGGQATTTTGGQATTTTKPATTTTSGQATTTTKPATTTTSGQATTTTKPATTTTAGQATTTTSGGATTTTIAGGGTISGSAAYTTECSNSVTADKSAIGFTAAGTIPASVTSGTPFLFSKQQWSVAVPGSVLQTGINLGLLTPGQKINGTVDVTVAASNTLEGSRTAAGIPLSITVQPTDVKVDFPVPDMSFTPAGGKIDIRFTKASMSVSIGLPAPVIFTCNATNNPVIVSVTASGPVIPTTTTTPPPSTTKPTSTTVVTNTTVASSGTGTLPATGPRQLLGQLILAAVLLDLGYLALSALRPPRRRPLS